MKYLRKFSSEAEYQAFMGGGSDYVEPHVIAIADGVSKSKMRYKKYVKPEVSPLEGGVILMTPDVGDTTELGKEIYVYLKKKCEGNSDSTYILSDSEGLTVHYKYTGAPMVMEVEINKVIIRLIKLPDGRVINALVLENNRDNVTFELQENGNVMYD